MNKIQRFLAGAAVLATLAVGSGCNANNDQPEMHPGPPNATTGTTTTTGSTTSAMAPAVSGSPAAGPMQGGPPMGMMTEDPRSVSSVEGQVDDVKSDEVMVTMADKGVTLRFHLMPSTVIKPEGKKLAQGQKVKIQIEHVPDGMAAKQIDIQ